MTTVVTGSCAGCGKSFSVNKLGTFAEGVIGKVCYGRGSQPSRICIAKAIAKNRCCPGCGAKGVALGTICSDCKAAIAKGKELQALNEFEWWGVRRLGPYLSTSDDPKLIFSDPAPLTILAEKLVNALASGRTITNRFDRPDEEVVGYTPTRDQKSLREDPPLYIELRRGQGQAFTELCDQIRHTLRLEYYTGFKYGNDLLRSLARGDITANEHDQRVSKTEKEFRDINGRESIEEGE